MARLQKQINTCTGTRLFRNSSIDKTFRIQPKIGYLVTIFKICNNYNFNIVEKCQTSEICVSRTYNRLKYICSFSVQFVQNSTEYKHRIQTLAPYFFSQRVNHRFSW